jgi:hypothetical protein
MISNRLHIIEIFQKGELTFGKRANIINLLYITGALIFIYSGIRVCKSYVEIIISSLAIFTGFYFTLMVYVTDKTINKIKEINLLDEELSELHITFQKKYKDFSGNLISQISYSVVLAILLILLVLLTQIQIHEIFNCDRYSLSQFFNFFSNLLFFIFSLKLFHLILLIISNMQSFFFEEINPSDKYL